MCQDHKQTNHNCLSKHEVNKSQNSPLHHHHQLIHQRSGHELRTTGDLHQGGWKGGGPCIIKFIIQLLIIYFILCLPPHGVRHIPGLHERGQCIMQTSRGKTHGHVPHSQHHGPASRHGEATFQYNASSSSSSYAYVAET